MLGSEGYGVETASDGVAGLDRATSGGFDLIVLDVMLPRMNGFDVCREVRQCGVTTPMLDADGEGAGGGQVVGSGATPTASATSRSTSERWK